MYIIKTLILFRKLEKILETGKVRVYVDVNDNMRFVGMGRSYRIAKCTAAKRALQHVKKMENHPKMPGNKSAQSKK
jgi:endoribonuclease Dicer